MIMLEFLDSQHSFDFFAVIFIIIYYEIRFLNYIHYRFLIPSDLDCLTRLI